MNWLLIGSAIASQMVFQQGELRLKFETPSAGSYFVFETVDFNRWQVIAANYETNACHVCAKLDGKPMAFYMVNFLADR